MHTSIIIDENHNDTAAATIAGVTGEYGPSEIVTLAQFLRDAGVRFDQDTGYLDWDEDAFTRRFGDTREHAICNRVVTVSEQTASALDGHRGILTTNFVLAAYARVLAEFPRVWGGLKRYPAGHLLPLNLQWRAFAERVHDVGTPRFAYGFGAQELDVSDFREPLWKSAFDLYTWKTAAGAARPELHPFVVDKPTGEPVVAYFVGEACDAFALRTYDEPGAEIKARLAACMAPVRDAFKPFMGECLFFVDGESIVFAAFSNHLKTSVAHERFASVVQAGMV